MGIVWLAYVTRFIYIYNSNLMKDFKAQYVECKYDIIRTVQRDIFA